MFSNSPLLNEYIWSAFITFIAAFLTAILPFLAGVPFEQSALFGLLAVGLRAGTAAVVNLIATKGTTVSSKPI